MRFERARYVGGWMSRVAAVCCVLAAPALPPFSSGAALRAQEAASDRSGSKDGSAAIVTIEVYAYGTSLEFAPSRISAQQGTRVRIRFVNEGTLPHNIVLVKDEGDIDMLGMAAFEAKETGYVPLEYENRLIAYTPLAAPGETVEMTFEVPPAGKYFFVCLYSGHYNMMVGTLRSLE